MKNPPLVSIVIPAKNSGKVLENCLKSIKSQTYKNIEIIIVDAGSKDNTDILAKRYGVHLYNYFPKVPKGTFDAPYRRNFGIKKAKGKYVYYVDDFLEACKLLIEKDIVLKPINIASKNTVSLYDLSKKIIRILKSDKSIVIDSSKPEGAVCRMFDTKLLESLTGFKEKIGLDEGLKRTIEYYKKNYH